MVVALQAAHTRFLDAGMRERDVIACIQSRVVGVGQMSVVGLSRQTVRWSVHWTTHECFVGFQATVVLVRTFLLLPPPPADAEDDDNGSDEEEDHSKNHAQNDAKCARTCSV